MKSANLFLVILFLVSCSSKEFKSRTIENYYQSSGVEKYFLSDIPTWANFSEVGKCFKKQSTRYFDIELLMKSFDITFPQAVQIQAVFNDDYNRLYSGLTSKTIPLSDEQILFFKASEKVNGKIKFFESPTFNKINLIWIDSMLQSPEEEKKLRAFIKSPVNDQGFPVLVSVCMSRFELELKFPDYNYKSITNEMLSVYNPDGTKSPRFNFQFKEFFKPEQILNFYSREKIQNNNEFNGITKAHNF